MKRRLSTDIRQTGNSCLIISSNIILNYFTGISSDELIRCFLKKEDRLFSDYGIDKQLLSHLSPECSFIYFYYSIVKVTNGGIQFSNEFITNSFRDLAVQHGISMERIEVKGKLDTIGETLKTKEAFLSLSYEIANLGWHATPIGYENEYYAVDARSGSYHNFGQNIHDLYSIDDIKDIGDGILFIKS